MVMVMVMAEGKRDSYRNTSGMNGNRWDELLSNNYKTKYGLNTPEILPIVRPKVKPDDQESGWCSWFVHYFLKTIVLGGCFAGCAWQCISILNIFLNFPTTVFVYVETMDKLYLPGITLCNSNRIMMSKLRDYNKSFDAYWSSYDDQNVDNNDNATKLDKQFLIDETIRVLLSKLTVNDFMRLGHSAEDLIIPEYFKCATDPYNPNEPCRKYANIITTGQDIGNCFSLFHRSKSEFLQDIAIQSGLSQSPVIRGHGEAVDIELADQPFHPNEILRLKINFSKAEYTTLNDAVFGYIIIHDDHESPPVRERSLLIYPGFYYEFFISKQTDLLLPAPYITDCINFEYQNEEDANNTSENEYLHFPLSRENCIIGCMGSGTMERCDCWPPELPFMKGSDMNTPENKMKWCDWNVGPQFKGIQKPENSTWFRYCFSEHEKECNTKCKLDCKIDRFGVLKQQRVWPSQERIEHSKHAEKLQANRDCCAMVSIRYWSAEHTVHQYQPKYEIVEFVSYLGGLLSMWLGFSLIHSYSLLEKAIVNIYKKYKKVRKTKRLVDISTPLRLKLRKTFSFEKGRRKHGFNLFKWGRSRAKVSNLADKTLKPESYDSRTAEAGLSADQA